MIKRDAKYFRIGLFTVAGLAVALALVVALGAARWFERTTAMEMYFDESVQGLDIGSKVKYRGVVLGQVTRISFTYEHYELDKPPSARKRYVMVEAAVRPERVGIRQYWDEDARIAEIAKGLRVKMVSQGVTGINYIEMDYLDPRSNPVLPLGWTPENFYVPSARSTVTQIVDAAEDAIRKWQRLDVEKSLANIDGLTTSLTRKIEAVDTAGLSTNANQTLNGLSEVPYAAIGQDALLLIRELRDTNKSLRTLLDHPAWKSVPVDAAAAASGARQLVENPAIPAALARLDQTTQRLDRLVANHEAELGETLANLRDASANLVKVTEAIKRQPSTLLFSPSPKALDRRAP